jgi:acyl-homoserine lactone acylase PvdQ
MKNFNAPMNAKVALIVTNQNNEVTYLFVEMDGTRKGERSFTNPDALALDTELANRKVADPNDATKQVDAPAHLVMVKANGKPTNVGDKINFFMPSDSTQMPFMAGANDAFRKRQFVKQLTAVTDIQQSLDLISANVTDATLASIVATPLYARAERIMQGNKPAVKAVSALQADAFKQ